MNFYYVYPPVFIYDYEEKYVNLTDLVTTISLYSIKEKK